MRAHCMLDSFGRPQAFQGCIKERLDATGRRCSPMMSSASFAADRKRAILSAAFRSVQAFSQEADVGMNIQVTRR